MAFSNISLTTMIARFESLSPRDQLALKCLAIVMIVVLLFYMIITPASHFNNKAQARYVETTETLSWMQANAGLVRQVSADRNQRNGGESLLGIANKTSKSYGLSFKRYQSAENNGLTLWLEGVSFNGLVMWTERLKKKHGIVVNDIVVDRVNELGMVNVRLLLQE